MLPYSSEEFLSVFETETPEERIENLIRNKNIFRYRVKTIRAGEMLDCEIFPIWNTRAEVRQAKAHKSRKAQERLNIENRKKKITRYGNENFTKADCWGTFTYDDEHLPATPEQARRDIRNLIRRMKRKAKKEGIKNFKYIYVTEGKKRSKKNGGGIRYHHHIVFTGGMDRDEVEQMWEGGARREVHRLQPDKFGITGLARYIGKKAKGKLYWGHSTNLDLPKESAADHKVSKRKAYKIAIDEHEARRIFEKLYEGYKFLDVKPLFSEYVSGVYLYVRMRAKSNRKRRE